MVDAFRLISIQSLQRVKLFSSSLTAMNNILVRAQHNQSLIVIYNIVNNQNRRQGKRRRMEIGIKCSKDHSFLFGYNNLFIWKNLAWFSDCFYVFILDLLEQRMNFVMQHNLFYLYLELFILLTLHAYICMQSIINYQSQSQFLQNRYINQISGNSEIQSRMNKSQSQTKMPKSKTNFIYQIEDETYIFQTKSLFMQVQFSSPIKEIFDYLEQYNKYAFLEELSSVGIKAAQYNEYYEGISKKIESQYRKFLQKTMAYVEEMIMSVHFLKIERWNLYKQIVKGYKNQLLDKDLDCYNFDSSQFMEDQKKVLEYLGKINKIKDPKESALIKMDIKKKKKVIQEKGKQFNQKSFVKNPFRAQNCRKADIFSDEVFSNYMKKIVAKSFSTEEALDLHFSNAYEGLRKFPQYVMQMSIKQQKLAYLIIKEYNRAPDSYFCSKIANLQRHDIDMSDFNTAWKKNSNKISILQNSIQKVEFSYRLICRDQQSKSDYSLNLVPNEKYRLQSSKTPEYYDTLQGRVPVNNPYFNIWDHVYDREKLKRLYFYYEEPKKNRSLSNSNNNIANRIRKKMKKERKNVGESIFKALIGERKSQQCQIWQNISGFESHQRNNNKVWRKAYENVEQRNEKKVDSTKKLFTGQEEEENKIVRKERKIEIYKQYLEKYDKDRKKGDELLGALRKNKTYQEYAHIFGIKNHQLYVRSSQIHRYGIQINVSLYENTNLPKLEEFLCHFLKEKLFREDPKYKDKQLMPLIQNLKPAEEFCDWRVIKKLGQLTQTFKKYYLWASQLIKYEEVTTINKQTIAKFTIYSYTDVKHSQSILFQLKRRLNVKVTGDIVQRYNKLGVYTIQSIMSKLEVMHRLIFNQHLETPSSQFSYLKGQHIFSLILKQIIGEINEQKLQ